MSGDELKQQITQLVKEAQNGDERAKGKLIDLTQNKLFKYSLLLGHNRELAEDLCQETYIKAFQSLSKISSPAAFQGWLYQIAKNLFIDMKRLKSSSETSTEDEYAEVHSSAEGPKMEAAMEVRKILSHFEPEERHLILLVELEGYSYQEAAELIGTTEDAVRSRLHRLRQQFIKNFNSRETK